VITIAIDPVLDLEREAKGQKGEMQHVKKMVKMKKRRTEIHTIT